MEGRIQLQRQLPLTHDFSLTGCLKISVIFVQGIPRNMTVAVFEFKIYLWHS